MRRIYASVAHAYAPFDEATLQGLGATNEPGWFRQWPVGRSYQSVANFRAPYDDGYFQDGSMMGLGAMGLGAVMSEPLNPADTATLPGPTQAFISGQKEPTPSAFYDAHILARQVPSWAYVGFGALVTYWAYTRYQKGI
jgi:hypothetical protein